MQNVLLINGNNMKRNLMTNEEKVAQDMIGTQGVNFNMAEGTINEIIEKENFRNKM